MIAFQLELADSADLLCRVIGLLAQRDLEIAALASGRATGKGLSLRIAVRELDDVSARIVAAKMARCIGVDRVRIEGCADPVDTCPVADSGAIAVPNARAA